MSRLKSAPEKRHAALARDHRTAMEAPHAFRKNWPKKKARVNRKRRRAADAAVRSVLEGADPEALVVPRRRPGEHLHKSGVASLGRVVARKVKRTGSDFLPSYVRPRRDPALHAPEFRAFLAAMIRGRSRVARERAAHFQWLLDARLPNNHAVRYQQAWLRRFFAAERQWEARVRRWCQGAQEPTT
jgi:hypothetical protein